MLISLYVQAQPLGIEDIVRDYPRKIKKINRQLKFMPENNKLIWDRTEMQAGLISSYSRLNYPYDPLDSSGLSRKLVYYEECREGFEIIYEKLIKKKNFNIVEEGDYFISRLGFYASMHQFEKSIEDAIYLRDSASYSQYYQRGDYYHKQALHALLQNYKAIGNLELALESVDSLIQIDKTHRPEQFYIAGRNIYEKIALLQHFKKNIEAINYVKEACKNNFDWYFSRNSKIEELPKNGFIKLGPEEIYSDRESYVFTLNRAKSQASHFFKIMLEVMEEEKHKELQRCQKIYESMHSQYNKRDIIKPELSDEDLKNLLLKL